MIGGIEQKVWRPRPKASPIPFYGVEGESPYLLAIIGMGSKPGERLSLIRCGSSKITYAVPKTLVYRTRE
jgi:hypothetical protein